MILVAHKTFSRVARAIIPIRLSPAVGLSEIARGSADPSSLAHIGFDLLLTMSAAFVEWVILSPFRWNRQPANSEGEIMDLDAVSIASRCKAECCTNNAANTPDVAPRSKV
ncbi:hypothetical protein AI27_00190 [Sphingomonas sp. BHC-A]|uniref:Uncharacterized protein n=1 Tax=Sphingobium indicum (strain DSM 16412 / CCM 7286 / MTCC 6364 / B90A) TaxID=861109 RepID=A0A1L5BKJ2_SPHIB|nr:hypothetical protein SIDU_01635 [Sphingobium indicum B90A]KEZ00586.1 hypothetical protein AI27_00190 [Sphingomonas sp. BHC-A]